MEVSLKTCKRGHLVTEDSVYRKRDGSISRCKQCSKEDSLKDENKAKRAKHEREVRATDHGRARQIWQDLRRYGLTIASYLNLLHLQDYKCALCRENFNLTKINRKGKDRPHIDHRHDNQEIRGLLCNYCNVGLGMMRENLILLDKAKVYLQKPKDLA